MFKLRVAGGVRVAKLLLLLLFCIVKVDLFKINGVVVDDDDEGGGGGGVVVEDVDEKVAE